MRARSIQHRLTQPARRTAVPVLSGAGRGLRVRFGESSLIRAFRTLEGRVETAILSELEGGATFYDVGANIGWYSLLAARAVGPAGRVLAFEPSFANAALTQANAAVNRLANVTVMCAALTDTDGWLTFLDKGNLQGRLDKDDFDAQGEFRAQRNQRVLARVPVPVARLDSWLEQTGEPPPDVVKIDVEGAELGVLRGMVRTLESAGPTLVVEMHRTQREVADFLDGAGYEHAPIEYPDRPTRDTPPLTHVLARPAGSATAALA